MRLATIALTLAITLPGVFAQNPEQRPKGDKEKKEQPVSVMRQKLDYANRILAGIATEDFDAIRQNAEAMQRIVRLKEFDRSKSTEYRAQLLIFDFATAELLRHAKKENRDGAALAYTQLTLSCVNCHKRLRAP